MWTLIIWGAVFFAVLLHTAKACASVVETPRDVHSQVRHAALRLKEYLARRCEGGDGKLVVRIRKGSVTDGGEEEYCIRSTGQRRIEIQANTDAGAANGLYALMMALRTRQVADPFAETWDLAETPRWAQRRVALGVFHMNLSRMTPDTWSVPEWKAHIDFLRQFSINYLSLMNLHMYHPDVPESLPNKWRLDVYKEVIAYAHEQGMKVSLMACYNQVPPAVFWARPEWRTQAVPGYFGHTLCWSKAKAEIIRYQKFMIDYLDGLDGIEIMVTEFLGWCACDQCVADHGAVFIDAVKTYREIFRAKNPGGEVAFWNWLLGYMPGLQPVFGALMPPKLFAEAAKIQPKVLAELPGDVIFLDLSRHQLRAALRWPADQPGQIEILDLAPEQERRAVDFMFYMDREFGMLDAAGVFPKPFLDLTVSEYDYIKDMSLAGVSSYRLAPPARFLSDFFYLRKSWNPGLTRDQLLDEAAGYLTRNSEDRRSVSGAIERIEQYWHKRERNDLLAAREALKKATEAAPCPELVRLCEGIEILTLVDDYARTIKDIEDAQDAEKDTGTLRQVREAKLLACFLAMKQSPQFQGFTSDGFWEPRAVKLILEPHMDLWARYINHRGYYD